MDEEKNSDFSEFFLFKGVNNMYEIENFLNAHSDWMKEYVKLHNSNNDEAKFKIGEKVTFKERTYMITGVNVIDSDTVEYSLDGYFFLVYEEELGKPEE